MPRDPSPAQVQASKQNGKRSRGPSSPESKARSSLNSTKSGLRAQTLALAHESIQYSERCNHWHNYYQPQSPAALHLTNQCAHGTLLADRAEQYRQAELEKQAREEERAWNRRELRRVRYLSTKIKKAPGKTVEQLKGFGQGVGFLFDCFEGLIDALRTEGYFPPNVAELAFQVCGSTQEPASIRANPLAYAIQINNLGCTPDVPAAVIAAWLEPANRPAALRDRPRHEVTGADPLECRERLLGVLQDERDRLGELDERVRPGRPLETVENEAILAATNDGDGVQDAGLTVGVTIDSDASSALTNGNDPLLSGAADPLGSVTNEPTTALTNNPLLPIPDRYAPGPIRPLETACEDDGIDWCGGARGTPRSDQDGSWRAFLRAAPLRPLEAGAGGKRPANHRRVEREGEDWE